MKINHHEDLEVFQLSYKVAMEIFELTTIFPKEEKYSLSDQIRRSSRSVCANIAEAFRKRIYIKSFVSKINDSEGEAAETQVWIKFSLSCKYIGKEKADELIAIYNTIIKKLVTMRIHSEKWTLNY
ncbi:MAG: four helix bundle protein [Bacteroidales bacterium]